MFRNLFSDFGEGAKGSLRKLKPNPEAYTNCILNSSRVLYWDSIGGHMGVVVKGDTRN